MRRARRRGTSDTDKGAPVKRRPIWWLGCATDHPSLFAGYDGEEGAPTIPFAELRDVSSSQGDFILLRACVMGFRSHTSRKTSGSREGCCVRLSMGPKLPTRKRRCLRTQSTSAMTSWYIDKTGLVSCGLFLPLLLLVLTTRRCRRPRTIDVPCSPSRSRPQDASWISTALRSFHLLPLASAEQWVTFVDERVRRVGGTVENDGRIVKNYHAGYLETTSFVGLSVDPDEVSGHQDGDDGKGKRIGQQCGWERNRRTLVSMQMFRAHVQNGMVQPGVRVRCHAGVNFHITMSSFA